MVNGDGYTTLADIAEVKNRKSRCQAQFDVEELVNTLTSFYQLLIRMGFWPEDSVNVPHQSSGSIDVKLARELGYSESCIDLMQRIPYPDDRVVYDRNRCLLEDARILDLHDEDDLREGRHPEGCDFDESPNIDGSILTLMAPRGQEGSVVLLDADIGCIYQYKMVWGPPSTSVEYRVQRHLDGDPKVETSEDLHQFAYKYAPFVPAAQYFRSWHNKYYSLRLLPFLELRLENDVNAKFVDQPGDEWLISYFRRRQAAVSGLYRELGWPRARFDRHELLKRWSIVEEEFRQETLKRMADEEAEQTEG